MARVSIVFTDLEDGQIQTEFDLDTTVETTPENDVLCKLDMTVAQLMSAHIQDEALKIVAYAKSRHQHYKTCEQCQKSARQETGLADGKPTTH